MLEEHFCHSRHGTKVVIPVSVMEFCVSYFQNYNRLNARSPTQLKSKSEGAGFFKLQWGEGGNGARD